MYFIIVKRISKLLLLGVLLLGSGCSKFLDEQDPSNLQPSNFYTIPEHATAAIASVYADTRFITGAANIVSINWQMLDAVTGTATTESAQNSDLNNLLGLAFDGSNRHIINWWNGLYKVIANANLVLDRVPGITPMDEAAKKKILGEALFLRAWAYFYAVRLWGDVPLVLAPQTASSEDFLPTRAPQEEVYNQIVADLVEAEAAGLPWTDPSGRVGTAAVKAQLSKVYLTMAGQPLNKGTSYYQLAAAKAKEIIDNPNGIDLFTNYGDLHNTATKNQVEHLFEIQFLSSVQANNDIQILLLPNFRPISAYTATFGTEVPTVKFYQSFEAGDLRTENQQGYFYTSYFLNGTGDVFELGAPYIFKHFDIAAQGSPGKVGTQNSSLNMPQIRFAEVLLNYAEAQNEADGAPSQAAYDAFKRIRDRAQLTTPALSTYTQATFREAVWRERWHELCYENLTWFDMIRLRKVYNDNTNGFDDFVGHINLSSNQPLQEKHLLFPLPTPEMQNNPNLTPQNPGYQ
ncbi:MAG: RagB/SusD family nutrient uptake outer membrane protein [Bacteroidota bacterium]